MATPVVPALGPMPGICGVSQMLMVLLTFCLLCGINICDHCLMLLDKVRNRSKRSTVHLPGMEHTHTYLKILLRTSMLSFF
jgi:hypothetical protein